MDAERIFGAFSKKTAKIPTRRQRSAHREDIFRAEVWRRDGGIDRATGQPLTKTADDWHQRGQVCHLKSRGAHPDKKFDPANAILLSGKNHWYSDARGGRRLKIIGEDGYRAITFRMTDKAGNVLWERTSKPVNP